MLRLCILGHCPRIAADALGCSHDMQMGEVDAEDMRIVIQSDEHILWADNIETNNIATTTSTGIGSVQFRSCSGHASWVNVALQHVP